MDFTNRAFSLLNEDSLIRMDVFDLIYRPAWPAHLDEVYHIRLSNPEVQAEIALREVTSSTADFINPFPLANQN